MAGPRDLCTLAEAKAYVGIDDEEDATAYDDELERLISAASRALSSAFGREFVAIADDQPEARVFPLDPRHVGSRIVPIGDLAGEPDLVEVLRRDTGDVVRELAASEYSALPRPRDEVQPVERLDLRFVRLTLHDDLRVTGSWGFPQVPEDVRQATLETVRAWFVRDVRQFSDTFSSEEGRPTLPRALPSSAFDLAGSYRRMGL